MAGKKVVKDKQLSNDEIDALVTEATKVVSAKAGTPPFPGKKAEPVKVVSQVSIQFPKASALSVGIAKGASIISKVTDKATYVRLRTAPQVRRGQLTVFKDCLAAFGRPLALPSLTFGRTPLKHIEVRPDAPEQLPAWTDISAPPTAAFWYSSPMLRAYLALWWCFEHEATPTDRNDIAHLLWLVRNKDSVLWRWPLDKNLNGNTPIPLQELTPLFNGAILLVVGTNKLPLKGG